jgi:hypothetical protein
MGLPAAQQRILDGIEDALRAGEPQLAAMYSIFTRLTGGESRPQREQLPSEYGWRSWPGRLHRALSVRRLHRSWRRLRRQPGGRNRFPVPRVLVLGQLMAILAVVGLMVGIGSTMAPAACTTQLGVHAAVAHARHLSCTQPDLGK